MSTISINELEVAINYYRDLEPSEAPTYRLSATARRLATPYALMIFYKRASMAVAELDSDQLAALAKVPARVKAGAAAALDRIAQQ